MPYFAKLHKYFYRATTHLHICSLRAPMSDICLCQKFLALSFLQKVPTSCTINAFLIEYQQFTQCMYICTLLALYLHSTCTMPARCTLIVVSCILRHRAIVKSFGATMFAISLYTRAFLPMLLSCLHMMPVPTQVQTGVQAKMFTACTLIPVEYQ